jgi:hypothetical protein
MRKHALHHECVKRFARLGVALNELYRAARDLCFHGAAVFHIEICDLARFFPFAGLVNRRVRGYSIHKSRNRSMHIDNHGEYMLVLNDMNCIVLGERFDASLDDIAEYLAS